MFRAAIACLALCAGACGRSEPVPDRDLGGLVLSPKTTADPIDVARAAAEPAELGRALGLPLHAVSGALGPVAVTIDTTTEVSEADKVVDSLSDHTAVELGELGKGEFHALYTNSADYGREVSFVGGALYLRPRYQKWHQRAPEASDEPKTLADSFYQPIAAAWDLLAPGAELVDGGAVTVGGRKGRKIVVKRAAEPRKPEPEPLAQRKWREGRLVDAVDGEIVLDADKGVPLTVNLTGAVSFQRDGRRFSMKLSVKAELSAIGTAATIAVPGSDEVVATPERMREVDDRDMLLQGIAPPTHHDGPAKPAVPK